MGRFVKGDVVVITFPFTDLSGSKKRPAFVVADLPGNDIIVCQITSKHNSDHLSLPVASDDFIAGTLPVDSFIRPNKLFTADRNLVLYTTGRLSDIKTNEALDTIIRIISS